jgi:gluconolactonase
MKRRNYHIIAFEGSLVIIFIAGICFFAAAQEKDPAKLFQSRSFTAPGSFISPEGPAVDAKGILYVVNYLHKGTVGQILPGGQAAIFMQLPNRSIGNGMRFTRSGDMIIADYINHNILKVDMAGRQSVILVHEPAMNQPNDIAIDKNDRLYASDPDWKKGTGRIWRIDPDGGARVLDSSMGTVNGIEVSPDDRVLYVNETVQRKIWAYDLSREGNISHKRLLIEFNDFGMDGMRCDRKGNLYVTRYGKGTVAKISPRGKLLREIVLNGKDPTNLAFGGKDGRTVYVTVKDNGNIESFLADIPGREWKMMKR